MSEKTSPPGMRKAAEVVAMCDLSAEALALLQPNQPIEAYFDLLLNRGLLVDGIKLMAHLLNVKQCLWWGCLAIWEYYRTRPDANADAVLKATIAWLREPTEEHRRAAGTAAQKATSAPPARLLGTAVFLAEGSISHPGLPEVPTKPHLTPKTVVNAVLVATRLAGASQMPHRQRDALGIAIDIYRGKNTWQTPKA